MAVRISANCVIVTPLMLQTRLAGLSGHIVTKRLVARLSCRKGSAMAASRSCAPPHERKEARRRGWSYLTEPRAHFVSVCVRALRCDENAHDHGRSVPPTLGAVIFLGQPAML